MAGGGGRVVGAVGLDDVVLDERAARPAVDGEVAVAVGLVGAGVRNGAEIGMKSASAGGQGEDETTNRDAAPGFHPFPPTRLPLLPDQVKVYDPPPLFW